VDLDFSPIQSVGNKSFSVILNLALCRFGMPTVLWAHNTHGGEACWGWRGEAAAQRHGHGQLVKWHGGRHGSEPGQGILSPGVGPMLGFGSRPCERLGWGPS
jgi:hypothetical protein